MYINRHGNLITTETAQDRLLAAVYSKPLLRLLAAPLTVPFVSNAVGKFLNSPLSKPFIAPFIRANRIDMRHFEGASSYSSFNDFFKRKIDPAARPKGNGKIISPSDGKASAYPLDGGASFCIKGVEYSVSSLLKSRAAARYYCGGTAIVIRLSVDNYHRYCYAASGVKSPQFKISGRLHTVNPAAIEKIPVFCENSREFCIIDTDEDRLVQMEVGALMVGKISNHEKYCAEVVKGKEKGCFEFGGSTIVLLLPRTRRVRADILENTLLGLETEVYYGENI